MQITVNIPDEFAVQVQARGLALETYVQGLVRSAVAVPRGQLIRLGPGPFSLEEAGRRIRNLRQNNNLDGIKVKDLIEEGRRV